uniref:Protein kinase domain-containing protein n=1 Tax=Leersia perrieri TaxID=77586 RepID=A0A0D9XCV5_9ORYZ
MAQLPFFVAVVLGGVASVVVGQQPGFLSIDCGLEANFSGYPDADNGGIFFVSDEPYISSGENHRVAAGQETGRLRPDTTVRSFPSGMRNCYSLPTVAGAKYLVRVVSFYGNYDGKNISSTLQFDLHIGANYWDTVYGDGDEVHEAMFVAWASWAPVCLVNTGQGIPFVSSVELRPLDDEMYPHVMANQSMRMYLRRSLGPTNAYVTREEEIGAAEVGNAEADGCCRARMAWVGARMQFPDDQYDRYWWEMTSNPLWANLSTSSNVQQESSFKLPSAVLRKAITVAGNGTMLNITWEDQTLRQFMAFAHFSDFQNSKLRQFNVYFNTDQPFPYTAPYLADGCVYSSHWYRAIDGKFNITVAATAKSVLPPMFNAFEIYTLITHDSRTTFSKDFDAIMAIKLEYKVEKNWMGDPCFPTKFAWDGVKCRTTSDNISRIISINLSGNQLNGPIPDSLCTMNAGSFIFSYDSNQDMCNKTSPSSSRNRAATLAISIAAPVLVVAVLGVAYLIWRLKRKPNISAENPPMGPGPTNAPGNEKYHWDHLQKNENRQFTYEELEKFTDNFQQLIGEGGFGRVYHGCLEGSTEVAVKMLSGTSSTGLNGFLAEVESLTKVHHKNLVSLVGYCSEKAHLALVYEYMARGNLFDHLRGKAAGGETLNWAIRVRVLLDAAQGLDYLHKGCNRSIIHRDVKTSNILLGQSLQAKIADFGLSRTYLSDTQSHMSATVAGSMGYIDPEYYQTGWITESSDVYSFGVVLLEVATGELPILQGHGHIVQRVKQYVAVGDIRSIADERLSGNYDVNSMWKVVEIALMCTESVAARRPSMATVVAQLKESLALEEAREDGGLHANSAGDAVAMLPTTFGPSAR